MKQSLMSLVVVAGLCSACVIASVEQPQAGEPAKPQGAAQPAMDPQAMQKMAEQMMQSMTPGEHHKQLERFAGEWDVKSKMWMMPGAPPMESTGTASSKFEFGGRFIFMTYNSQMMGQPFEGRLIMGYNNNAKQFEATWVDNMSTGIWNSTGASSENGKVFTWNGTFTEPDGEKKTTREVSTFRSDDQYVSEFFETGKDGKEVKMMELTYTRKAKAASKPATIEPSK